MAEIELLLFLEALAVKGAFLDTPRSNEHGCPMVTPPAGISQPEIRVPLSLVAAAQAAGWLTGETLIGPYRLSRQGRNAYRQARAWRTAQRTAPGVVATAQVSASITRREPKSNPSRNDHESPVGWLRKRLDRNGQALISEAQYGAGERLRADLWRARMTPHVTASWSGLARSRSERRGAPGTGLDLTEQRVAAHQRVTRALIAVGPEFADILIDVCGHLKGLEDIERTEHWPQRSAKLILQKALTSLARHYCLLPTEAPAEMVNRLLHWGAEGYRPSLEQWK